MVCFTDESSYYKPVVGPLGGPSCHGAALLLGAVEAHRDFDPKRRRRCALPPHSIWAAVGPPSVEGSFSSAARPAAATPLWATIGRPSVASTDSEG